ADLRKQGFVGITTNSTYDAWTPSRAYSHYHGGVRILSETASAKLATPITVKVDQLRAAERYDPRKEADNFGAVWNGGEWHLRDSTRYMRRAAFSLMNDAASNREEWLSRFYSIGKEAVRPRKLRELVAYAIPPQKNDDFIVGAINEAGVDFIESKQFTVNGKTFPERTLILKLDQPYG